MPFIRSPACFYFVKTNQIDFTSVILPTTMSPTSPWYLKDKTEGPPSVKRLHYKTKLPFEISVKQG